MKEEIIDIDERGNLLASESTPNYNLIKPSQDDFYNVDDFNQNMDIVDEQLKISADQIKNLEDQVKNIDVTWEGITGKPDSFPPSDHTNHPSIDTGMIRGNALTTGNKQMVNHTTDTVYVGNPTINLHLESKVDPKVTVGSSVFTLLHSGSKVNADTVDGKHASDFRPSTWIPTKADVGLGSVNNWGATTAVNSTSTTTYATASAVKIAYDKGVEALSTADGASKGYKTVACGGLSSADYTRTGKGVLTLSGGNTSSINVTVVCDGKTYTFPMTYGSSLTFYYTTSIKVLKIADHIKYVDSMAL